MSTKQAIGLIGTTVLTIRAISDPRYFSGWYAVCWGIITAIGFVSMARSTDWWESPRLRLQPAIQMALLLCLTAALFFATSWGSLTSRDAIQLTWTLTSVTLYWKGVTWAFGTLFHRTPAC